MAPSPGTLRVGRYFAVLLGLLVVLYGIVFWPHQRHTPKLGLDLKGGAQVVLHAQLTGGKTPTRADMQQAQSILTNRVDAQGVSNAEVVIEYPDRIVISVPGKAGQNLQDVSQAALLQFRPELQAPIAATTATPTTGASTSASASSSATARSTASAKASATAKSTGTASSTGTPVVTPAATSSAAPAAFRVPATTGTHAVLLAASATATPSPTPAATGTPTPVAKGTPIPTASPSVSGTAAAGSTAAPNTDNTPIDQWATLGFTPPTTPAALAALSSTQSAQLQAAVSSWDCNNTPKDDPAKPLITCDTAHQQKYLLGPVIVAGRQISSASAQAPDATTLQSTWSVLLSLKSSGQTAWSDYTSKHNSGSDPNDVGDYVAFTLDSQVLTAPQINSTINGSTQITGGFSQSQAENLANALKFGALPISFTQDTATTVSATPATQQLTAGLLAGGIGLALVVVYSLLYYRALGLVTIASLIVSGLLTYAMLVILGIHINLTLTLAGIAGFIVAVGITADSFVVFFERIKDEVHEGRSAKVAVPRAWIRARRTIISADSVSLLAAVVLYEFAAGDVRGFAFTLGLSTVLDLVVVFLFTHPLVSLISRSESFGSARLSGLNSLRAARPDLAFAGPAYGFTEDPEPPAASPTASASNGSASNGSTSNGKATKPVPPAKSGGASPPRKAVKPKPGQTAAERAAARRGLTPQDSPDAGTEGDSA